MDDSDQQYPVVIFSHGLGGCRSTYSVLCAELASQVMLGLATGHVLLPLPIPSKSLMRLPTSAMALAFLCLCSCTSAPCMDNLQRCF